MSNAQCAHVSVYYNPIENPDGTKSPRWACRGCDSEFRPIFPFPGVPYPKGDDAMREVWFCPRCFAAEDGGSWGGVVDEQFCSNCSASQSGLKLPRWAVHSIREQASWVGKRFYPNPEDRESYEELRALRREMRAFPGRSARPAKDQVGAWWVEQRLADGRVAACLIDAETAEKALDLSVDRLPWVKKPAPLPTPTLQ